MNEKNRKEEGMEQAEAIVDEAAREPDYAQQEESQEFEEDSQKPGEDAGGPEGEAAQKEDNSDGNDSPEPKEAGKKGFFGKKKEKKDPKDAQIEELTDRVRRTMAEFDNFRKRTEKEKSAMFEIGAKDIVERMLPVIDNFERGLASMPEDVKGTSFAEGMEMIYKQLLKNLEEAGVKPIEAIGQPFDPNFHNAVMHIEDDSLGENVVAQELQKGYMYRDSVVRHSMVQVAN